MSTPDERFELVTKSIESVRDLTKDLSAIGVYDEDEYKAAGLLLKSLNRAMFILDPKRADEYIKDMLSDFANELDGVPQRPEGGGLYL